MSIRICRALLPAALLLLCPHAGFARSLDKTAVDQAVRQALKAWHVPGAAVAIVRDDEVIYLAGHGVREAGEKAPVTPDTLFPIASCTKSFTTAALAILVDEGKVGWDDPVRKHLPFFHLSDPLADDEVKLRDLLCHRTGLAGHDLMWYRSPWGPEERVRRTGLLPLDRPFRSAFQYQSTMFTAAGLAIGSASGQSWADFVQKRLFDPLGMKSCLFTTTAAEKVADRALPHRLNGLGEPAVIPFYPMPVPDAAGTIQATARDLSAWLRFHLGDGTFAGQRIVSARNLEETHRPQMMLHMDRMDHAMFPRTHQMSYGMGWVIQDHCGHQLLQHAGAIDGFRAHFTLVPGERLGLVILNNLQQTRMNIALSNRLLDLLLGLPPHDWNALILAAQRRERQEVAAQEREELSRRHLDTHPSRELAAYQGNYDHPAYGRIRVALEGDGLRWHWNNFSGLLVHYHYDTFNLPLVECPSGTSTVPIPALTDTHVVFTLDTAGRVARMKVLGTMNAEFRRIAR
jgi:CubicO group peptidase (beta-lactamase class C family)